MYEFFKNNTGEEIEGYLSTKDNFNGIVFLLREPNSKKPTDFWFKNVLDGTVVGQTPSKYKNRFQQMLIAAGLAHENAALDVLKNAVYCNIHPEFGENSATRSFHKKKRDRSKLFLDDFPRKHKELTIFTLWDIFDIFLEHLEPLEAISKKGLEYSNTRKRCFQATKDGCKITVYEIIHPSRSSEVKVEIKTEYCKHN